MRTGFGGIVAPYNTVTHPAFLEYPARLGRSPLASSTQRKNLGAGLAGPL
jgi:hypothetical protein